MAKAKKATSAKTFDPYAAAQKTNRMLARNIGEQLYHLELLFIYYAKPLKEGFSFLPPLPKKVMDWRLRRTKIALSDQGKADTLLLRSELERRAKMARKSLLEHAATARCLFEPYIEIKRADLMAFGRTSAAIGLNCLRLYKQFGKTKTLVDLIRRTIRTKSPQDMPDWCSNGSARTIITWTYLTDLEAIIDEWGTHTNELRVPPCAPKGHFFEFLPTAVRYRGRELHLRNGLAKNILIQLAFRFDQLVLHAELPLNNSPKASANLRQAVRQIRTVLKKNNIPCGVENIRSEGYRLHPVPSDM
jgi:hypothetical protein